MLGESPPPEPTTLPAIPCPWCAYTADILKQVLMHMESVHHHRWSDLALLPPIAGGPVT